MNHGHVSDADLIDRARRGDQRAYGELVRRYLRPALAAAWEFSDSREDAEDLVQEAFHRLEQKKVPVESKAHLTGRLVKILRLVAKERRKKKGRIKYGEGRVGHLDTQIIATLAAEQSGPMTRTAKEEQTRLILRNVSGT